jgi:hypothetical protein
MAVSVTGTAPNVGASTQFTATASMSSGASQAVTSQATWQPSATSVATVTSSGVVTGVSAGSADITATYQNGSGIAHISVTRLTFTVSGTVTDGTSGGVLPNVNVQAAAPNGTLTTTTNGSGTYSVTGIAAGSVTITASASGYQTTSKTATVVSDARVDMILPRTGSSRTPTPGPVAAPGLPSRTASGSTFVCSLNDIVHPAACVNDMFGNATALCNDGARSWSTNNSGTYSSHGSVYCWVCPGALCPQ